MSQRILVIGSSNTDMVARVSRFPAPGETISGRDFETFAGGKGANQAVAATRAGGIVTFASAIGDDHLGQRALAALEQEGIDTAFIKKISGVASGVALITVNGVGENQIVVVPGANEYQLPEDLRPIDVARYAVVILQCEIPLETVTAALQLARQAGCVTIVNPAPAVQLPESVKPLIDILVPNEHELAVCAAGGLEPGANLRDHARRLIGGGIENIVVTMGKEGAAWYSRNEEFSVPAPRAKAIDTVGAGDCFTGAFAVAIAEGRDMAAAMDFACHAAAFSVQRRGAQPSFPKREDIEASVLRGLANQPSA
jgi:ribokinase